MPEPLRPTPVPRRPFDGSDRLESWKEIAAYLGREVRTVQGWEKNEGLPVHRHLHSRQGSVYAFKSELDAWRDARRSLAAMPASTDAPEVPAAPDPEPRRPRRLILWAGVGIALVSFALAAVLVTVFRSRQGIQFSKGVPVTSAPGQELEPSLSPEGSRVAYSWNGDHADNYDIYVKLLGPGPPVRLTTDPAKDSSPAWSRDGRSIAFLRELRAGTAQVIVIPSLGGPERVVGEVLAWPEPWRAYPGPHLTWLPDGKSLIVSHRQDVKQPFALYLLALDTGRLRKITNPPAYMSGDTAPALSPDGHQLAFRRATGFAAGQLYLQQLDEQATALGEPRLLTPDGISTTSPAWTSDARDIIYSDGYYFDAVLKRVNVGSGKVEPLGVSGAFVTTSASKMVYTASTFDTNVWEVRLGDKPGNPSAVDLINSTRMDTGAQYSPDGKRIAFLSQRSGSAEIWICDRDAKNFVQLTSFGDAAAPRWSPDGSEIAFLARYKGLEKIYVVRAAGGEPRQVTSGPGRDHAPSWSRDGRIIYFRSSRSGSYEVWKVPATGGAASQVTHLGGDLTLEAPDGTLYYSKQAGLDWSLWKLSGGVESQVLPSVYPMTNFFVTATGIYFTPHANPDGSTSIQLYRFADRRLETVTPLLKPIWFGLSVSPDERSLLYTQLDHEESNLMLADRTQ